MSTPLLARVRELAENSICGDKNCTLATDILTALTPAVESGPSGAEEMQAEYNFPPGGGERGKYLLRYQTPPPTDTQRPLTMPANRERLIQRAIEADDSSCSAGYTPPPTEPTCEACKDGISRASNHTCGIEADGPTEPEGELVDWYPFGGLNGLLSEIETALRGHGAECVNPESCGPLGCLLAKIHHTKAALARARGK